MLRSMAKILCNGSYSMPELDGVLVNCGGFADSYWK